MAKQDKETVDAVLYKDVRPGDRVQVWRNGDGYVATGKGGEVLGTSDSKTTLTEVIRQSKEKNK